MALVRRSALQRGAGRGKNLRTADRPLRAGLQVESTGHRQPRPLDMSADEALGR